MIYRADALRSRYDHLLKLFRPDIYDRIRFDKPTAKLYIRSDRKKKQTKNLVYNTKPHKDISEPSKPLKPKKQLMVDEISSINFLAEMKEEEVIEEEEYEILPPSPPHSPPPKGKIDQCGGNDEIEDYEYDTKKEDEIRLAQKYNKKKKNNDNDEIIDEIDEDDDNHLIYQQSQNQQNNQNDEINDEEDDRDNNRLIYQQSQNKEHNYNDDEINESIKDSFKDSFVNESKFERSDSK